MVISAIAAQNHFDTNDYLRRVKNASGNLANNVQIELNEFVKWHYRSGLRSTNGLNHIVVFCAVFITTTLNGYLESLWHSTTNKNMTLNSGSPSYSSDGLSLLDTIINTDLNIQSINRLNCSFGYFKAQVARERSGFAYQSGTADFGIYAQWVDGITYFSLYNTGFDYLQPSISNTKGLFVGEGDNGRKLYLNGTLISSDTNTTFDSLPNVTFELFGRNTDPALVGGIFAGLKIPDASKANHYEVWRRLQNSASSNRIP